MVRVLLGGAQRVALTKLQMALGFDFHKLMLIQNLILVKLTRLVETRTKSEEVGTHGIPAVNEWIL